LGRGGGRTSLLKKKDAAHQEIRKKTQNFQEFRLKEEEKRDLYLGYAMSGMKSSRLGRSIEDLGAAFLQETELENDLSLGRGNEFNQSMHGRGDVKWRPKAKYAKGKLGTFQGVYVPCMLSIIGVILFLRLGWAVGQAGVMGVIGMFMIAGTMAFLTDLSLSAMATNGRVSGGGTYYLLSRSVGPELGGAIGIIFYCANVIGIAFYMTGFGETMATILNIPQSSKWIKFAMATGVLIFEMIIAVVGSSLYAKCALVVFFIQMVAICWGTVCLLTVSPFSCQDHHGMFNSTLSPHAGWVCESSVDQTKMLLEFTGPSMKTLSENLWPDFDQGATFLTVFGIIFPAMTGIMAGTNMSGVLRRPDLAIPRGELSALASALFTYLIVIIALGCSVPRKTLQNEYLILSQVANPSAVVTTGILVSTTSSALASIQSGARLLQAIAQDELIPALRIFRKQWNGEPALAVIVSISIAEMFLLIGNLDIIAPILTMFFLLTYAMTNFATFLHSIAGHPNFRPRFKFFSWHTALIGFIMCFGLMFYLAWYITLVALVLMLLLSVYISILAPKTEWGDVTQSLIFHQVRKYLLRMRSENHVKFWRLQLLYITPSPTGIVNNLEFVNNLKKGGLFVIGDINVRSSLIPAPTSPADTASAGAGAGAGAGANSPASGGAERAGARRRSPNKTDRQNSSEKGATHELTSLVEQDHSREQSEVKDKKEREREHARKYEQYREHFGHGYDVGVDAFATYQERREKWVSFLDDTRFKAFVETTIASSMRHGVCNLLMTAGLGGLRPNTVILGFYSDLDFAKLSAAGVDSRDRHLNSVYDPSAGDSLRLTLSVTSEWRRGGAKKPPAVRTPGVGLSPRKIRRAKGQGLANPARPVSPDTGEGGAPTSRLSFGADGIAGAIRRKSNDYGYGHGYGYRFGKAGTLGKQPAAAQQTPKRPSIQDDGGGRASTTTPLNSMNVPVNPLTADQDTDDSSEWWNQQTCSDFEDELEYTKVLRDIQTFERNILLLRNFHELDKREIVEQFHAAESDQGAKGADGEDREKVEPFSIDIWEVPWGSTDSFALALQLASMLHEQRFWGKYTKLRVCSLIETDSNDLQNTKTKYAELHQKVIRDDRIPATIEVFVLSEVSPMLYQQACDQRDEMVLAAQDHTPTTSDYTLDGDSDSSRFPPVFQILPPWRLAQLFHTSILDHRLAEHAAVMFLPLLPVPPPGRGLVAEKEDLEEARGYIDLISNTTKDFGPVLLVQAVVNVISVEL
jgi:potassium/chloride transporter 9